MPPEGRPAASKTLRTILAVDDEPEIRKLVRAVLTSEGYEVLVAESGAQAIKIFKKDPAKFDLLLTDVVAPGMSGPMLADQLTELKPSLKVIFMSGYDSSQVVQRYVVERGFVLLIKPFAFDELKLAVQNAFGQQTAHGGRAEVD